MGAIPAGSLSAGERDRFDGARVRKTRVVSKQEGESYRSVEAAAAGESDSPTARFSGLKQNPSAWVRADVEVNRRSRVCGWLYFSPDLSGAGSETR